MTITTRAPATRRTNPQDIQHPRRWAALTQLHRRNGVRVVSRPTPIRPPLMPAHCQTPTSEDLMPDADDGPSPQPAVRALASGSP
jgi:hypothetical protein